MANTALARHALRKPAKGSKKREKACAKARQRRSDWFVYQAVDLRDGLRCRICLEYRGLDIQRHHIVPRSLGGLTTTANVVSLCAECHLIGVHGKKLTISGNADEKLKIKCAVTMLNGQATSWAIWEGSV